VTTNHATIQSLFSEAIHINLDATDFQCEIIWRRKLIKDTLANQQEPKDLNAESLEITLLLIDVLKSALDNNTRPSIERIDIIYENILKLFRKDSGEIKDRSRQRRKCRRAIRRYIYACTQDLYKKNPSSLTKHIRNGTDWCNLANTQLNKEDIKQLYNQLRNTKLTIQQLYTTEICYH